MTDEPTDDQAPGVDPGLVALLADRTVWDEPDPAIEASILAAIRDERPAPAPAPAARRRLGARPRLALVAAVVVVVIGLVAVVQDDDTPDGIELALAPTDVAPTAAGSVHIAATPLGTKLLLDVAGLAPAPEGQYYEAWLRKDAEVGVSAGTFHLRGGDGEIELWAGVGVDDYPLITVTLQDEAQAVSSGIVVLRGLLGE